MKYLITLFVLFGFIYVAGATDLAEVAKKEKARREALAKEGKKAKTLTNADVANLKTSLGIETTKTEEEVAGKAATPDQRPQMQSATAEEEKDKEREEKIEQYREEIEKLKKQAEEQRSAASEGGSSHTANIGSQYRNVSDTEELIDDLEEDIKKLEAEKEKE